MKHLFARSIFAGVLLCLASAAFPVCADPVTFGQWYEFRFLGPGSFGTACALPFCFPGVDSTFAPGPPWTFSSSVSVNVTLTDAFPAGDSFSLFDFDNLIGSTPLVAVSIGCTNDPNVCLADPTVSHRVFVLPPGNHSLTIRADNVPFGTGAAFFRVDPVPEPTTLLLLGTGLGGLAIKTRKKFRTRKRKDGNI